MANPVNGIYRPPDTLPMSGVASSAATPSPQQGLDSPSLKSGILRDEGDDEDDDGLLMGIEVGAECIESRRQRTMPASSSRSSLSNVSAVSSAGHRPSMTLIVPATSYSSSEEEDFFDANEYNETPSSTATPTIGGLRPFVEQQSLEECPGNSSRQDDSNERSSSAPPKVHDDGTLDYDALYEDESDPENGIDNQGTVISHLISQVKIGMDLTKVVLPTFILERRSLLEMYADYFAHPDLFVKIADFKDPKDRMVQVLRWYVSAYHAGRKSAVAKKPYNPIIGEIFQCYWDIPDTVDEDQSPATDGPIPWCSKNQLTFIAEQVSHHPPISAFYAEHYNRRISFCAHVWTKSKFLGLSVGVHNIGQGCISVLDYDEEYIVTFPNGYGRSILTTPWIELGGSVAISCAKTGYNATVEFLTKPFYGGKKNRIVAEVYKPNEKKSFLTITGEWNGLMEAKWADGRQEVFVDVNKINVVKKKVRPIAQQEDYESRKLWKEVTAGLRLKDIDRATNAKFELEQKQREEAKIRKEEGLAWETKVFHLAGENWVYKEPLVKRLSSKQNPL